MHLVGFAGFQSLPMSFLTKALGRLSAFFININLTCAKFKGTVDRAWPEPDPGMKFVKNLVIARAK